MMFIQNTMISMHCSGFLIRIFVQRHTGSKARCQPQSTMMDQSCSISIEGLNHVVPIWSNRSSKVGHLVFSLGHWCAIVAYQIPCLSLVTCMVYMWSCLVETLISSWRNFHKRNHQFPQSGICCNP